jgi:hypothetical protein
VNDLADALRRLAEAIERREGNPLPEFRLPGNQRLDDGMCDACRRGGVCGCVRPGRQEWFC